MNSAPPCKVMRSGFSEVRLGRDSRRDEYISTGRVKPRSAPRGPNRYVLSCRVALSRRGQVDNGPLKKSVLVILWCYSGRFWGVIPDEG